MAGFTSQIGKCRHARLHAEGHLVGSDAGDDFGISKPRMLLLIHPPQQIELMAALSGGDTGRIVESEHRWPALAQRNTRVPRGQKTASPEALQQGLPVTDTAGQHDIAGEILVFGAQTIRQPGAHGGAISLHGA